MLIRYGRHHKEKLVEDFDGKYYNAGMVVSWFPLLIIVIIVTAWALIHVGITLVTTE